MKNKSCVNTKSKDFKSLSSKYKIDNGDLELAIKQLPEAGNNMSYEELEKYVENYFKVTTTIPYSDKTDYNKALNLWKFLKVEANDSSLSSVKAKKVYNAAIFLFGQENVIMFKDKEAKWKVNVSQPIYENIKVDKKPSALEAIFNKGTIIEGIDVSGMSIEDVFQKVIKRSDKNGNPSKDSKLYKPYNYKNAIPFIRQLALLGRFQVPSNNLEYIREEDKKRKDLNKISKKSPSYVVLQSLLDFSKFADVNIDKLDVSANTKVRIKKVQQDFKKITAYNPIKNSLISEEEAAVRASEFKEMYLIYTQLISDIVEEIWKIKLKTEPNKYSAHDLTISGESELLHDKTEIEDYFYRVGYLPLWEEWEKQNSELTNKLQEAVDTLNRIIEDTKNHITFDYDTHEYFIDGNKVDMSVTQYIHGGNDIDELWKIPSVRIGNSVDRFVRAYFKGEDVLKLDIPNLGKKGKKYLKEDLDKLVKFLNKKFGVDKDGNPLYKVFTDEIHIAGTYNYIDSKGKSVAKTIAGTPDIIIVDNEGNFYIYDIKTKRTNSSSVWKEDTVEGYYKQLSMYKAILEANYPELKGKIKDMKLLRFDVAYPTPQGIFNKRGENIGTVEYEEGDSDDDIDTLYITNDDMDNYIPIEEYKEYSSPRLSTAEDNGLFNVKEIKPEGEFSSYSSLPEEDKNALEDELGEAETFSNFEQEEKDKQVDALYNPGVLPASERTFLGNTAMSYTSFIISQLHNDSEANSQFFGDEFINYNFTSMPREEIINIVGISKILNYVKEMYFNPYNREDIEDTNTLTKLKVAYDNWGALIQSAYSKLITLEDTTVISSAPENIKREDLDEDLLDWAEGATLEEKEREYWQIGQRQISARASLSSDIRRTFERLPVIDKEGDNVADKYGYNFMTFVDSGEAVNRILDWVQHCTSVQEMENVLEEKADTYSWLNNILSEIKKEPFRSMFYQNFRKQFTQYSIVNVRKDNKRNKTYDVHIINTKGASQALLDGIVTAYNSGIMTDIIIPIKGDLEGKGRVNVKKVEQLNTLTSRLLKTLQTAHSSKKLKSTLSKELNNISSILSSIGIPVELATLQEAFAKDSSKKNFNNTNIYEVLNSLSYLLGTILDNKDNTEYNPVKKGDEGNVYGNYKNILIILSKYIQDSIESSTYENGKMHYSFVTPSYLGKLVTNLKNALSDSNKFQKFLQNEYGSYRFFKDGDTWKNVWLDKIANSEEARQQFDYKVQLSFDSTPYTDLSELGYTLSLLSEYFYDKSTSGKNQKLAWYRVPILANKPSSEFIRFRRYTGKNYKRYITAGLREVFDQEVMRIQTVLQRSINANVNKIGVKDKITFDLKNSMMTDELRLHIAEQALTLDDFVKNDNLAFHGSGAEFKFLEALNNELINGTTLGQMIVTKINGKDVNEEDFNKEFEKAINLYMERMVDRELSNWESIGLFDTETSNIINKNGKKESITTYKYLKTLDIGSNLDEIKGNLEEYVWNDMFATINIIELTATDLAYYKNIEDFQKRYAQVHSPAMRLNIEAKDPKGRLYSSDGIERTIYLKDSIKSSDIIPNIEKALDDRIAELSGVEKSHMVMMKDLILQSFEEVNVADAQGYSSPTSYRKKLGMMGRWTTEMEEAYDRIIEGNYNVNDLGVLWQPFKPFVYSQIRKPSGASAMSELKVPVQNKNSEYLLFLADAIMKGNKQTNKLVAIFDFMEDSAYDGRASKNGKVIKKGVYNGRGIDTVQFESAVNSGSMGSIDLNNIDKYEDIKEALNNAVFYDRTTKEYNDQYVHSISFEDYGIQQEVPAHLVDHQQLMGSQIRILSISDITPGTTFEVGGESISDEELKDEYQNLIAENIRDSFNKLIKDFRLKGTRKERNKALSRLLTKAILEDQRYGSDLLRACSLNSEGEFVIPINDPIQSIRVQQLLNSIIKTRINKQKVQGGPAVQASSFGLSKDLNIRFRDKKGNILDTLEEFASKKRKSKEEVYESYRKYLNKNQYSIAYFECYMPIPSESLEKALTKEDGTLMDIEEAVSRGIITEDMRKAVGYRIPTEDKYSMAPLYIKGFLPKAAGEAIMLPKEITTLSGSDFDIDKMYIMLKAFSEPDWGTLEADIMNTDKSDSETRKKHRAALKVVINLIKKGKVQFAKDSFESRVFDYYKENLNRYRTLTLKQRDKRNNRIFDLQWAVLTSPDTMSKIFNPGSFDVQKKAARIINILKSGVTNYSYDELSAMSLDELDTLMESGSNRNIIFSSTQVYFHKQNMTAGKLIGVFANNNTSHAFLSMQDITLNLGDEGFMFDGYPVNDKINNKLDSLYAKDGALISKTIAGFLAASVDAVKDPVLNFMNLNTFTANTAMLLARLGFDTDSIGMFLTQPLIEKVTREYFKRSNEGYTTVDEVINSFLPEDYDLVEGIKASLSSTPFTKEDLAEGLIANQTDTSFQLSALLLFQKLSSIAQDLSTLTFLTKFNSVTNAVGPTIADTLVMRERYKKFLDKMEDNPPFNEEAMYVIENNPILQAFFETTVADGGASELLFKGYFPHYGSRFSTLLGILRQNVKGQLDSKIINKVVNDFMYYKLTLGDNPVIDGSEDSRRKFINDFVKVFNDKSTGITDNDLLKIIKVKGTDYKCPVPTLEAKTGGYGIDVQERVKSAWSDLILNPSTRELGTDLFFYNIYRNGFGFSPKTFGHLASVDVRVNVPRYVETIRNVEFNDDYVSVYDFIYMFLRNHSNEFKLVPRFTPSEKVKISEDNRSKSITFSFNKKKYGMDSIIVSSSALGTTFAPVIMYNDKLYMKLIYAEGDTSVTYTETTPLGNTNNFLEYDEEGAFMKSVINNNPIVYSSKETPDKQPSKDSPEEVQYKRSFTTKEIKDILKEMAPDSEWRKLFTRYEPEDRQIFRREIVKNVLKELNVDPKKHTETIERLVTEKIKEVTKKTC